MATSSSLSFAAPIEKVWGTVVKKLILLATPFLKLIRLQNRLNTKLLVVVGLGLKKLPLASRNLVIMKQWLPLKRRPPDRQL